jgi:hypothetical protein
MCLLWFVGTGFIITFEFDVSNLEGFSSVCLTLGPAGISFEAFMTSAALVELAFYLIPFNTFLMALYLRIFSFCNYLSFMDFFLFS